LSRLVIPKIETVETSEKYGKFKIEPLEKGIGITLGNVLRRMLLGYLPGGAVTWVKIDGIQHEFSTIPDMKEDTMDFLLNLRAARFRVLSGRPGLMKLEVTGESKVYASDIQPTDDFEVANPELHLATLDSPDARLSVELNVEIGEGYREAESDDNLPVGAIPVDAVFTPIRKVNYTIEPVHIGRETSRERLNLEVWTDGTILPIDAISSSSGMLAELLSPFVDYSKVAQLGVEEEASRPTVPDEKYEISVEELDLSVRTMNALRRAGISTVGELVNKEEIELLALRNFGQKSRQEVIDKLGSMGLTLQSMGEADEDDEGEADDNIGAESADNSEAVAENLEE